jgi:hypothetical protein
MPKFVDWSIYFDFGQINGYLGQIKRYIGQIIIEIGQIIKPIIASGKAKWLILMGKLCKTGTKSGKDGQKCSNESGNRR